MILYFHCCHVGGRMHFMVDFLLLSGLCHSQTCPGLRTLLNPCLHSYFQTGDMDIEMAVWWSFDQSRPFFSLTNVTIPAVLTIVLVILGGLAYILQVVGDSYIHIYMEAELGPKTRQCYCNHSHHTFWNISWGCVYQSQPKVETKT